MTPEPGQNGRKPADLSRRRCRFALRRPLPGSALLDLAVDELGVAKASLTVKDGVVSGGGKIGHVRRLCSATSCSTSACRLLAEPRRPARPAPRPISQYKIVGTTGIHRIDIPAKVNGKFTYVHNIRVPGMLHGRVVRPRGQGAYGDGTAPQILSVDESSIKHIPNVKIVRSGEFLGVVRRRSTTAIQAAAQLKVKWADLPTISGSATSGSRCATYDSAGQAPARIGRE